MSKPLLLTPGPTPVPPEVLQTLAQPMIHHRTDTYRKIFKEVSEGLKRIFKTKNPVYTFTSSGTGAMEAALVNFHSPGDTVLVVEAGKFGERFTQIAQAYGLKAEVLKVAYGETADPAEVENAVKKNPNIKSVCLQLCETSTGVAVDLQEIGKRLKGGPLLIVDAISGLAADDLETDAWGMDLVISGSQKALMLPPGLAFLSVSPRSAERMKQAKLPRFYFNLALYEKGLAQDDTPFTPAISLVIALRESLRLIEKEGIDPMLKRAADLARYTREALKKIGFELFAKRPSNGVTAVKVPAGIDGKALVKNLRDKEDIWIAEGQGEMAGKIIRLAHMGFIQKQDIDKGLAAIRGTVLKGTGLASG